MILAFKMTGLFYIMCVFYTHTALPRTPGYNLAITLKDSNNSSLTAKENLFFLVSLHNFPKSLKKHSYS